MKNIGVIFSYLLVVGAEIIYIVQSSNSILPTNNVDILMKTSVFGSFDVLLLLFVIYIIKNNKG